MSPRSREQFKEMREEKKQLIMNTALQLFSEKGYSHTSISDIASRAGISKGLMYNYFSGKNGLLSDILQTGMDEIFSSIDRDHDGVLTEGEFTHFVRTLFSLLRSRKEFWRLYFGLIAQPEVFRELASTGFLRSFESNKQMLDMHFREKGMKDPEVLSQMFLALIDGLAFQVIFLPEMFDEDASKVFEDKIIELFK